jgi:hypothetical protein
VANLNEWHDFFVAQAGASAALAGLMFVALSINIDRILKSPWLPPRAASTMTLLIGSVVQALLALWPAQSLRVLGWEELVAAVIVFTYASWLILSGERTPKEYGGTASSVFFVEFAAFPAVAGSLAIVGFGLEGGLYAVALSMILAIVVGVVNSWVLLVEILR